MENSTDFTFSFPGDEEQLLLMWKKISCVRCWRPQRELSEVVASAAAADYKFENEKNLVLQS